MSRALATLAMLFLAGLPGPCSKKEDAPAPLPEPVKGPTAETNAKWTKARADYEKSAKANGTKPEVVAAMLALIDKAKAAGDDHLSSGSKVDLQVKDEELKTAAGPAHLSIEMKVGADGCRGIDKRTNAEGLGLRLDYYLFDPKDDGVWVTATVNEMSEPLHLVENGSPRDVKQLGANLLVVIQAPGKAPLRIERKFDVRGIEMQGKIRSDHVFAKYAIYEKEAGMLQDRMCGAITEMLGLR